MELGKNYLTILDDKHEEFKAIKESYDRVIKELEYMESFIPEFFSKNGEAAGIKSMYKDMKVAMESPVYHMSIKCADVPRGYHIYEEYVDGMKQFIEEIGALEDDSSLKEFEEKFSVARDKDSVFIESLYGGKLNEVTDMDISEAAQNVEFLIYFIPQIKEIKSSCEHFHEMCESITPGSKKAQLFSEGANLLFDSLSNYCYSTVRHIADNYYDIKNTLAGKTENVTESGYVLV